MRDEKANVKDMVGATITATDGRMWRLYHEQDCYESVLQDLIGEPLALAEESSNGDAPRPDAYSASWTWTFYRFATAKGGVQVRWLGESSGYYSESVSFKRVA